MSENKLKETEQSIDEFLAGVPAKKRDDAETLVEIMREVSGEEPVVWGYGIVGFGKYTYRYASGRTGEAGKLGFSPRSPATVIYFPDGFDGKQDQLARLGKHKISKVCLYVNKLADIDLDVLKEMLAETWADVRDFDDYTH